MISLVLFFRKPGVTANNKAELLPYKNAKGQLITSISDQLSKDNG
jgi:hypothetical protein